MKTIISNINEGILHIMHLNRNRNYEIKTVPIYDEYSWSDIVQDAEWIITSSSNNSDNSSSSSSDNGALWMYNWDLSNNPGHCMNDFAFSAALDLIDDDDDDNSNTTDIIQQPYYTYFVHAEHMLLENECNTFCCKLFAERFGLIDYQMQIRPYLENNSNTTTTNIITKPTLCFDQITFPKLEAVRHQYNDVTNRGIQMLRERSWMVMKNDLDSTPWSASLSEEPNDANEAVDSSNSNGTISPHPTSVPKILLFDRYDATSRHLVNAPDIISKLQQSYNIQIYRVPATEWSNATLLHQAKLFNSYQYIISPHGAHLFNMIHARPQTKILEIQCPVLNRRWGTHQQWFSMYGPAINVQWRTYTELEGCKEDGQVLFNYTPKNITVDVDKVVTEAVEHFDLKPKRARQLERHEDSNWIDYDTAAALAATIDTTLSESEEVAITTSLAPRQAIQPYTIQDALYESDMFEYTFCILVYDQSRDKFITLYSKDHEWKSGNSKMWKGE